MITYEAYDPQNPEHGKFLLTLLREVGKELCADFHRDYLLTIRTLDRTASLEQPKTYLVVVNGERAGYISIDTDEGIGKLEGASLKRFQRYFYAKETTAWFCNYVFQNLNVHKIKAIIPIRKRYGKRLKWSPAELVCRKVGFNKEGLLRKELVFDGRPVDAVLLAVFPDSLRMES